MDYQELFILHHNILFDNQHIQYYKNQNLRGFNYILAIIFCFDSFILIFNGVLQYCPPRLYAYNMHMINHVSLLIWLHISLDITESLFNTLSSCLLNNTSLNFDDSYNNQFFMFHENLNLLWYLIHNTFFRIALSFHL